MNLLHPVAIMAVGTILAYLAGTTTGLLSVVLVIAAVCVSGVALMLIGAMAHDDGVKEGQEQQNEE